MSFFSIDFVVTAWLLSGFKISWRTQIFRQDLRLSWKRFYRRTLHAAMHEHGRKRGENGRMLYHHLHERESKGVAGAWVSIGVDKPGKEEQREVYQVEPPTKCDIDDTAGVWVSTWVHRSRCCWNFPAKGVAPPEVLCRSHRRSPKLLRHCFCRYRSSEATRAFYRWVAIANEGKAVL
nr:hypothetical protein Iba_chr09cCG10950 [Ipomoea batatas]